MVSSFYKFKAKELVAEAKERNLIKTYSEFCKTLIGEKSLLSEMEVNDYISNCKGMNEK